MKNLFERATEWLDQYAPLVYSGLMLACAAVSFVFGNAEAMAAWIVATFWSLFAQIERKRADIAEAREQKAMNAICDLALWIKDNTKIFRTDSQAKSAEDGGAE